MGPSKITTAQTGCTPERHSFLNTGRFLNIINSAGSGLQPPDSVRTRFESIFRAGDVHKLSLYADDLLLYMSNLYMYKTYTILE